VGREERGKEREGKGSGKKERKEKQRFSPSAYCQSTPLEGFCRHAVRRENILCCRSLDLSAVRQSHCLVKHDVRIVPKCWHPAFSSVVPSRRISCINKAIYSYDQY